MHLVGARYVNNLQNSQGVRVVCAHLHRGLTWSCLTIDCVVNGLLLLQFERTLIVADEDSQVSYLEGCTAPSYDKNQVSFISAFL